MRHRKAGRKLGRTTAHREMLLRNLLTSLFRYEKIVTTEAKAKELRKLTDKVVTLAKRGDLHARRQAAEVIQDEDVLKKLFDSIGGRYKDRNGGYTRLTKLEYRMGDGAPLAAIELAEIGSSVEPVSKPAKRRSRGGDKGKTPKPRPAEPMAAQPSGA
jgi:large subunit ribosomal protein L17